MTPGPLTLVLAEVEAGTATVPEMARHAHLDEQVVRSAIDHLVRTGRLQASPLAVGCPEGGCGGCAQSSGCGSASAGGRALVTLSLTRRHRA